MMIENRDEISEASRKADSQPEIATENAPESGEIGTGKKVGLYGCAFLILAVIIITAIVILTGVYVPFQGTEGVGP